MKVYVASSWRNHYQPKVVATLKSEGFDVYDFRNPPNGAGFGWEQVIGSDKRANAPYLFSAEDWRTAVDHPIARAGYHADIDGVRSCDAIVLVLPSGRSAAFEFGYAMGMEYAHDMNGRPGRKLNAIVYSPDPCEPELMFREAFIVSTLDDVVRLLKAPQ